jgi:NADPH-dependent 2,4-dienoyl-CoA reductase/sulfur reductase-like enzyme
MERNIDLVIIGGGPAGMAAAIEAQKNGVDDIVVIERDKALGGILKQCIHNGFGLHIFNEELTGPEYSFRFTQQISKLGIDVRLNTMVLDIDEKKNVTTISSDHGLIVFKAKAIIFAMGCRERTRGALNIAGQRPAGVLTAGSAQYMVNMQGYMPGKKVVVLGSGDIGLIMARRMTLEGAKVEMVCELMPYSGGLTRNIVQCLDDYDIPLMLSHTVVDIHGKQRLTGITIAKVDENLTPIKETKQYVACDTLLLSVGLIPENELSQGLGVAMDAVTSGPVVNESMQTSIDGVFACGNVVHVHDLVDFVTQESMLAGKCAAQYVLNMASDRDEKSYKTVAGSAVRYVVPHSIRVSNLKDESKLFFRTDNEYEAVTIKVRCGDEILYSKKARKVVPGEMESIHVKKIDFSKVSGDEIVIDVIKGE